MWYVRTMMSVNFLSCLPSTKIHIFICLFKVRTLGTYIISHSVFIFSTSSSSSSSSFFFFCLSVTAQSGPGPPHCWGRQITNEETPTVGRTPSDGWSAWRRDLYLTTHTHTHTRDRHPCPPGGIRTWSPRKLSAVDPRLRPLCHWDRLYYPLKTLWLPQNSWRVRGM